MYLTEDFKADVTERHVDYIHIASGFDLVFKLITGMQVDTSIQLSVVLTSTATHLSSTDLG